MRIGIVPYIVGTALLIATLFATQYGMQRAMSRFDADPFSDLRVALAPATLQLALENMPFGTGLGSFEEIYAGNESSDDLFSGYANRAHNDWAEFFLETGLPGTIIGALFLAWLALRTVEIWRPKPLQSGDTYSMLERGATLVLLLLLAHSLADYPLRTTAVAGIFALAAAILVPFRRTDDLQVNAFDGFPTRSFQ